LNSLEVLSEWDSLPSKSFTRESHVDELAISCDCSGLFNLLLSHLSITLPYRLSRPKAVHYFNLLQEIGSNKISTLKPGHLLAWRKDVLPSSGDTGHVLMLESEPVLLRDKVYSVSVYDATKRCDGVSKRSIELHTNEQGVLIGAKLHQDESKVKRMPIYHAKIEGSRYCFGCALPHKMCMCGHVEASKDQTSVVIFRHPEERKKTISTVSLIKQRFPSVLVKDSEVFPEPRAKEREQQVLIFPGGDIVEAGFAQLNMQAEAKSLERQYILIDATWRKAKKILHLNPWLAELPRASLSLDKLSNYLVRKVPSEDALSTVETFASAVGDSALTTLFDLFMQKQIQMIGADCYRQNYAGHINYSDD